MSDACPHCAGPYCDAHRPPGAHDCPGVDADRTTGWVIDLDGRDADDTAGDTSTGGDPEGDGLVSLLYPGRWLAAATLLLVIAVLAAAVFGAVGTGELNETRVERLIAERVNEERRAAGREPLAYNRTLAAVAEAHSRDMRERGYVGHVSPDGAGLRERYARFGLSCPGGENIYHTPRGGLASSERALADLVVRSWMDSPGHRRTLLKARFDAQGVGVALAPDGDAYVTQDFC